ncbi:MAG TPA: FMN-binding negative transcriptional regulator [Jatrophihabitans sp.]|jgi:transcriptional regulator
MYVPAHFAATDQTVQSLLGSITAVDLISPSPQGLIATFLPMLYEPSADGPGVLLGHVARNNTHWRDAHGESLVIVRGPDAYISPNWYAAKAEHGRVVPTWNYLTAHVYGRLVVHDDVEWLRSLVTRLTDRHEAGLPTPWAVTDAPSQYIEGQLRAIVGLELVIDRIEAKAKLSQNRSEADRAGVIEALGADPIADLM